MRRFLFCLACLALGSPVWADEVNELKKIIAIQQAQIQKLMKPTEKLYDVRDKISFVTVTGVSASEVTIQKADFLVKVIDGRYYAQISFDFRSPLRLQNFTFRVNDVRVGGSFYVSLPCQASSTDCSALIYTEEMGANYKDRFNNITYVVLPTDGQYDSGVHTFNGSIQLLAKPSWVNL